MFDQRIIVQIGYAKQKQYGGSHARKHYVAEGEKGWVTRCTGKPATREYQGWHTTVTCQECKHIIAEEYPK